MMTVLTSWWRANLPADPAGRRFVAGSLVDNLGSGVRDVILPLFLVQIAGLPVAEVGTGLLVSGLIGLLGAPFAGRAADRAGAKTALTLGCTLNAVVSCLLISIHSLAAMCLLLAVSRVATQFSRVGRLTILAHVAGERRNTLRAQINIFNNVGVAVGMGVSATALTLGTRSAYLAGFLLDAVTFLIAVAIQLPIRVDAIAGPAVTPPRAPAPWRHLFTDHRYAVATALNGLLCLHQAILFLGIPLWIAATHLVPRPVTAVLFLLNLTLVIALQVRFSAPVRGLAPAARSWRRSATGVAGACALMVAATRVDSTAVRVALVVGAGALLTLGELCYSAAETEISTVLAPAEHRGLYQGVFVLGRDAAQTAGPLVAALFCVSLHAWGWGLLLAGFALFAVLAPAAVRHPEPVSV
ncbi:major facilitator superfamily protein [Actinoplanes sp. SE50]|nr:major facilitator superfamily MFS_1 [Actinoplanes sp. SE50/110]ATO79670.1 major facilitator superfamily protein [Actinoplanes sp. SE50]SLL97073.1 hypothetical protein ACSP50_0269 [Actinoplanes sp. SE50/110]